MLGTLWEWKGKGWMGENKIRWKYGDWWIQLHVLPEKISTKTKKGRNSRPMVPGYAMMETLRDRKGGQI